MNEALPTEIITADKEGLWIKLKLLVLFFSEYEFNDLLCIIIIIVNIAPRIYFP